MTRSEHPINIDDSFLPRPNPGWGCCAEELLHHTSRYYSYAESVLRKLSGNTRFNLNGYHAETLNREQRRLLAAILSRAPSTVTAFALTQFVDSVCCENGLVEHCLTKHFCNRMKVSPSHRHALHYYPIHKPSLPDGVNPLDPFLNLASRLRIPVAVRGQSVDVPMCQLARHLDSSSHQIRENLQNAIVWLHEANYHLRNQPGLTHSRARESPSNRVLH